MPWFEPFVLLRIEYPVIDTQSATPGVSARIVSIWSITCCVRPIAAASGNCTLTNAYPWSSVGRNPSATD